MDYIHILLMDWTITRSQCLTVTLGIKIRLNQMLIIWLQLNLHFHPHIPHILPPIRIPAQLQFVLDGCEGSRAITLMVFLYIVSCRQVISSINAV